LFPAKDMVFPRRRYGTRLTAAVPAAEVHVLLGVGHVAMWDDPQLVARAIVEFTSRHQSRV
jgi:pimeloyl-ACP methyl ester carboxylesterase